MQHLARRRITAVIPSLPPENAKRGDQNPADDRSYPKRDTLHSAALRLSLRFCSTFSAALSSAR
jgi:hypothetical protein